MRFGNMRHRIMIMTPNGSTRNQLGEIVPSFLVFHPGLAPLNLKVIKGDDDIAIYTPVNWDGKSTFNLENSEYAYNAYVVMNASNESLESERYRYTTNYKITMRYVPGIKPDYIILYNGKRLKIDSVVELNGQQRTLEISAYEELL